MLPACLHPGRPRPHTLRARSGPRSTAVFEKTWQCSAYPPEGKVTFYDVIVEYDNQVVAPAWKASVVDQNCDMTAHIEDENTSEQSKSTTTTTCSMWGRWAWACAARVGACRQPTRCCLLPCSLHHLEPQRRRRRRLHQHHGLNASLCGALRPSPPRVFALPRRQLCGQASGDARRR